MRGKERTRWRSEGDEEEEEEEQEEDGEEELLAVGSFA